VLSVTNTRACSWSCSQLIALFKIRACVFKGGRIQGELWYPVQVDGVNKDSYAVTFECNCEKLHVLDSVLRTKSLRTKYIFSADQTQINKSQQSVESAAKSCRTILHGNFGRDYSWGKALNALR
jgi:hypothetical protein